MSQRSDIAPSTLSVELDPDGVFVEYLDGREIFYRGVPEKRTDSVRCQPGKEVHVLVTDPAGTEGVMMYINDRNTHDDILESTGVGRLMVEPGETVQVFPGVTAHADGYAIVIEADTDVADGRVFVFEEDELGERSFELVNE
ncbi:MAG: DUF5796 family protein [Halobacteriales archaeon]